MKRTIFPSQRLNALAAEGTQRTPGAGGTAQAAVVQTSAAASAGPDDGLKALLLQAECAKFWRRHGFSVEQNGAQGRAALPAMPLPSRLLPEVNP